MSRPTIAILGAGPAGVGAAWQVHLQGKAQAVVLERRGEVGGNAGSFELDGVHVDYGSHRLHPSCEPRILEDIRRLLGADLLDRPRHGRIRLRNRWIHFPLKPLDLMLRLPPSFGLGVLADAASKALRNGAGSGETDTFASVLERGLGRTICRDFYFPYAHKMWGLPPEALSATQARRRVSAGSLSKMVGKVLGLVPGFRKPGAGRFFYPCGGFGRLSQIIAEQADNAGATLRLNTTVKRLARGSRWQLEVESSGQNERLEADLIWSTMPLGVLARLVEPAAPAEVLASAERLESRAMMLIYLVLETPQFTPFDAHYFPEREIVLTRLSEPKNYTASKEPADCTVLCGELPCSADDELWKSSDGALGEVMRGALQRCGLPVRCPVRRVVVRRLPHAYPIYRSGYEEHFERVDRWVNSLPSLLSFGRQGLFAHDNTHHALAMAYAAADCLSHDGAFDAAAWATRRQAFERHVVED